MKGHAGAEEKATVAFQLRREQYWGKCGSGSGG
jgi:hypothetical protein